MASKACAAARAARPSLPAAHSAGEKAPCIPVIFAAAFRNLKLAGRAAAGDVVGGGDGDAGRVISRRFVAPADHAGSAGGGSFDFLLASFSLAFSLALLLQDARSPRDATVSAASFLRSLRAPVAGVPPGASAAGAGGCCDQGSAGVLSGGTETEGLPSVRAGRAGIGRGTAARCGLERIGRWRREGSAGAGGLVGVSIQGSDPPRAWPRVLVCRSGRAYRDGLGLPGAATKGSAGAEAPAQGSSELSATSTIAPSRLLLALTALWRARRRRLVRGLCDGCECQRSARRVPAAVGCRHSCRFCLALPVQL